MAGGGWLSGIRKFGYLQMEDKKRRRRRMIALCTVACIIFGMFVILYMICETAQERKTVLYSTDLAIDGDFDDYFDLVVMKSLEGIDLKIIVDGNDGAQKQSGVDAIRNLEKIAGGGYQDRVEVIIGRDHNLQSLYDADVDHRLVELLEDAKGKIDIVTVGSLRDVAALYNHDPELFEQKVGRIWIFAGDAEGTMAEYNVSLDETAFLRIMNWCEVDIYWIPCFQNGIWTRGTNTSYFVTKHEEILHDADPVLLMWFLYRFEKSGANFQSYMKDNKNTVEFMEDERNLWCAPLFPLLDDSMENYLDSYNQEYNLNVDLPCGFSEKRIMFSEGGKVAYGKGNMIHVFEIYDNERYVDFMKYILKRIFGAWAVSGQGGNKNSQ